ncbi:type IVB secretion system protein IcmH/DotU [Pseudomonas sp. HR96]|uniref:type IVB secretion system protein IcmH/DotU n=1 Tax=Pseudomonas sp. HR96 TaxID=1027966 RepID=UPI002A758AFF|nr:type IVB secretion system protein IcmH/DotU [Pseudomonas sp. HR96]WPP01753.1 type IVB secretion system protein IcmH/DotU [Pseudomonas sp. HR96]
MEDRLMKDQPSIAAQLPPSFRELTPSGYDEAPPQVNEGLGLEVDAPFMLRGAFTNIMLDTNNVLFGLAIRLGTLDGHDDVPRLYQQVSDQIRNILAEVGQCGYDDASFKAFSYCMCLFMDEAVMSRPWGASSIWSEHSLLSEFHQETNGGEKIFILIERMSEEPAKYQDVLEFMYFCVALGLEGKYAQEKDCDEQTQALLVRMHRVIRKQRGPVREFPDPLAHVVHRKRRHRREWPWWSPYAAAAVVMAIIYTSYSMRLESITLEVLESLHPLMNP